MSPVAYKTLPFWERPDLSPYLIHLTRGSQELDKYSALDNLRSILKTGEIRGSKKEGFIKGARAAACFMDVPFIALKYICTEKNAGRYEPYGIVVRKREAYAAGARPVLYLSNKELGDLKISDREKWRIVRFEVTEAGWISWLHEREWRCLEKFILPESVPAVLVRKTADAMELHDEIRRAKKGEFRCLPRSVLPLEVVCQGLTLP